MTQAPGGVAAGGGHPERPSGELAAVPPPAVPALPMDDDAELLRLSAAGDDNAFARFVTRHQQGVWRRATALADNAADAEDVLQETFLAAWRGAAAFRGGNARSWLLTIATHAWQRLGRKTARLSTEAEAAGSGESLEALAQRAGWGAADPTDDDRVELVRAAFARLSHDDRRLLTLRDIEEMSGEAVAELLGLTLAAMKSRLHRARLRLAAAYEEVRRGSA